MKIDGGMELQPIKNKLDISILYRFPAFYTYFNKTNNIQDS